MLFDHHEPVDRLEVAMGDGVDGRTGRESIRKLASPNDSGVIVSLAVAAWNCSGLLTWEVMSVFSEKLHSVGQPNSELDIGCECTFLLKPTILASSRIVDVFVSVTRRGSGAMKSGRPLDERDFTLTHSTPALEQA
jgi:hypothetical protein